MVPLTRLAVPISIQSLPVLPGTAFEEFEVIDRERFTCELLAGQYPH